MLGDEGALDLVHGAAAGQAVGAVGERAQQGDRDVAGALGRCPVLRVDRGKGRLQTFTEEAVAVAAVGDADALTGRRAQQCLVGGAAATLALCCGLLIILPLLLLGGAGSGFLILCVLPPHDAGAGSDDRRRDKRDRQVQSPGLDKT